MKEMTVALVHILLPCYTTRLGFESRHEQIKTWVFLRSLSPRKIWQYDKYYVCLKNYLLRSCKYHMSVRKSAHTSTKFN